MQSKFIKKFNQSEIIETVKNLTIPLPALSAVNKATIEFLEENPDCDPFSIFITICQPNIVKGTIEVEVFKTNNLERG